MKAVDWSLALAFAASSSPSGFKLSPEECRELSKLLSDSIGTERELDLANARIDYLMSPDSSRSPEGGPSWRHVMPNELPGGTPVSPGTTLYAFDGGDGHWEYDLPRLPISSSKE